MSNTNLVLDSYCDSFIESGDFMSALEKYEKNVSWEKRETKELKFIEIPQFPMTAQQDAAALGITNIEAYNDTAEENGFGLVVSDGTNNYLLRNGAFRSICDRLHISGAVLGKLERHDLAQIFNICVKEAKGNSILRYDGNKVCAIQGADAGEYVVLHSPTIFKTAQKILNEKFPGSSFTSGSLSHDFLCAKWNLDAYASVLMQNTIKSGANVLGKFSPSLYIGTSDTGYSSVVVIPMLQRKGNGTIPLLGKIKVMHKNRSSMEKVEEAIEMVLNSFDDKVAELSSLTSIPINNGKNAILRIGKAIMLPKKAVYETAEIFEAINPQDFTNAFEVYLSLCEAATIANGSETDPLKIARTNDNLAKALKCRWKDYDIAGAFAW